MVLGVISLAATIPLIATGALTLQDSARQQQVRIEEAALTTEKCSIRLRATARSSDERRKIVADHQLTLVGKKVIEEQGESRRTATTPKAPQNRRTEQRKIGALEG